jgi:hypothetical protein
MARRDSHYRGFLLEVFLDFALFALCALIAVQVFMGAHSYSGRAAAIAHLDAQMTTLAEQFKAAGGDADRFAQAASVAVVPGAGVSGAEVSGAAGAAASGAPGGAAASFQIDYDADFQVEDSAQAEGANKPPYWIAGNLAQEAPSLGQANTLHLELHSKDSVLESLDVAAAPLQEGAHDGR